jgi:hypothetical protein
VTAVRIRKTIDSDTLHLPELIPFIGHTVDIVIEEKADAGAVAPTVSPGTGDWDAVLEASRRLTDYDYDAQSAQDARDIADAEDCAG